LLDYTALAFPIDTVSAKKDPITPYNPRNDMDAFNWGLYDPVDMDGCAVGLQIVGRRFQEETVLGAARIIEEVVKR
jgi:Asp-tRNA(Asn)/Glu-tRNA(Gln) amidotransferase A subunit family amidase